MTQLKIIDETKQLQHYALKLLTRREYSRHELYQRLTKISTDKQHIETVLNDLARNKLQSDHRFTENFIRYRTNQGYGPLRIIYDLKQRGISEELITAELKPYQERWLEKIAVLHQKKFKVIPKDATSKSKQQRYLLQRGFYAEDVAQFFRVKNECVSVDPII